MQRAAAVIEEKIVEPCSVELVVGFDAGGQFPGLFFLQADGAVTGVYWRGEGEPGGPFVGAASCEAEHDEEEKKVPFHFFWLQNSSFFTLAKIGYFCLK